MSSPRRVFGLVLLGSLLLQAAWILSLPTFRGIDEYDHVFKAEAVADGQWLSREPAPEGRGSLVEIDEETIRAAGPVCDWLDYSGDGVCHPVELLGNGRATVGTAAGSYNPTYYVLVGWAAQPFAGDAADRVMRMVTALLCSLLLAWSAALFSRWARTAWPLLCFLAGLTPVFMYSTAIATPNGLSYAGAALVWSSVLSLDRVPERAAQAQFPFAVGAVTLLVTHTTGPLWLLLIGLAVLLLRPFREWLHVLRPRWVSWTAVFGAVVTVTLACVAWTRQAGANQLAGPQEEFAGSFPWDAFMASHLLWLIQGVAVFPTRNERAPALVYACWGLVLVAMLILLVRNAVRREKWVLGLLVLLILTIPSLLSFLTYASEGFAWQGRYALPLWIGVSILAARALDRRGTPPGPVTLLAFFLATTVASVTATVAVGLREVDLGVSLPAAEQFPGGFVVVGILAATGTMIPVAALRHSPKGLGRVVHPARTGP